MSILEELNMKKVQYWEEITKLNKIDLDKIRVRKIDSATCSVFKLYYETDMEELLLRIRFDNTYGEFKH